MPHTDFVGPDGEKWPSVTSIIGLLDKPYLYYWYGINGWKKCQKIKKDSQEVGSAFHDLIDKRFNGEPCKRKNKYYRQARPMVEALFNNWVTPNNVISICGEQHVVSEEHKFHGTFDRVIKIQDALYLIDWKSSSRISPVEMALQLAGYALAYGKVTDGGIVRVDKITYDIEVKTFHNLPQYYDAFLNLRHVWDYVHHRGLYARKIEKDL